MPNTLTAPEKVMKLEETNLRLRKLVVKLATVLGTHGDRNPEIEALLEAADDEIPAWKV